MTLYEFAYIVSKMIFSIVTFRTPLKAYGKENIPAGGAVICSNHVHNSDPFYIVYSFHRKDKIWIMAKEEIRHYPVVGTRHEEIGEGKTGAAMMAIRTGVPVLPVYIAPERTPFHRTKVYIGEPYQPFTENRRATAEDYEAVTEEIMDHIRAVRDRRAEMEARG